MGPQDPKDVAQVVARDLTSVVGELSSMKAHANHWLKDPNYEALRLRLETAHAAAEAALVEARRRQRIDARGGSYRWVSLLGCLKRLGPGRRRGE